MANCNACDKRECDGAVVINAGMRISGWDEEKCPKFRPIRPKVKLVEAAMSHPQGLYNTLNNLPFKVNLDKYLRRLK